ncbi:2,3-bisphosphoglycerate-dependent phosphoglycerate mutase 2-like isoform X4 [Magnolia sinica]|uniref:2,3-bisphosphoglycerate-dependent phosphoglycerate mutase 2-like isoform X4 n=1 Tax=Magnolia sinica TaxID=86752 RepID=UPI00265922B0|nr:2,3-bisphosphoglycerate-dependent phosphoglycerate mutase 2-like isoform X4 [Magnolia sinica]
MYLNVIHRMVATTFHHAIGTIHAQRCCNGSDSQRLISKGGTVGIRLSERRIGCSSGLKSGAIHASTSHTSVVDPVLLPSNNNNNDSRKKSNETALILIRHGESLWNEKNLFTGCVDVPLTKKGVEEAIEAGKRISSIPIDMIYTSSLIRAQMTAMLAMTQHRRKKVPIIMHNESEQAKAWGQIFSEETKKQSIPVITAWQLNERMYGELQGLNKQETADRYGKEQVHEWRRSYDIPPPNAGELLKAWHGVHLGKQRTLLWRMAILVVWWSVWEGRNGRCFRNENRRAEIISQRVRLRILEWTPISDKLKDCNLLFLGL